MTQGQPQGASYFRPIAAVLIVLAICAVILAVLFARRASSASAPPLPFDEPLPPAEAARLTDAVSESPEAEIFEAEATEALSIFAGLLEGTVTKGVKQGLGAQIISGIVHEVALDAITQAKGVRTGLALAPITVLEMVYQCSSLGGEDTSGCATSSTFLVMQLANKWKGAPSAARAWFNAAKTTYNIRPPEKSFGSLARFVRNVRLAHQAARTATTAASKQVVGATAARVSAAATKIAATAVAQSSGPVANAAAARGVAGSVRVAASGARAIGARVGASVAGQLASKAVSFLGGPVGVAVFVMQFTLGAVTAYLDSACSGDFASHCHATRETLERLTGRGSPMKQTFDNEMRRRFGDDAGTYKDKMLLQPLSFDAERVEVARAALRGVVYRQVFAQMLALDRFQFSTMDAWVDRLSTLEKGQQFAEIFEVAKHVATEGELVLDDLVPKELCKQAEGYTFDSKQSHAKCRATRGACCKRAAAVASMVRAAHARSSACAAIKFAVCAIGDAGAAADVYEAMGADATPEQWRAWDALAFARTRTTRAHGLVKPRLFADDILRVACTLGIVDLLAERRKVGSSAEALALLRAKFTEGLAAVFGEPGLELPSDELLVPWPKQDDRTWLHTDPMLMGLAVRWIRTGAPGEPTKTGESHEEACAAEGAGFCAPDFAQYTHTHVCPHIHAGKEVNEKPDPRVYDDARIGHSVVWSTGECSASTAYCEEYSFHPEPVDTNAKCPSDEDAALKLGETAYAVGLLKGNICGAPPQCNAKRRYCSKLSAGACKCSPAISNQVISNIGGGETGAGWIKKQCNGTIFGSILGFGLQ